MTEFDPFKRPKTPPKVAWFEFLLNPSLLEGHLQKDVSDPSACELIALFLYQADLANVTAKEIAKNSEDSGAINLDPPDDPNNNKKVKALKALALSVATFLKWNLDMLEESLPLATVESILIELLSATLPGVEPIAKRHAALDLKALTPEAVISVLLYHRWCLRTAVKDKFPVKPSKVPNVQVPGLLDPSVQSAIKKDSILSNVRDSVEDSCLVLEHYMEHRPEVTLPTMKCFPFVTESIESQTHDWSMATVIPQEEVLCQVGYELGTLYFYRQDYPRAWQVFVDTQRHLDSLPEDQRLFVDVDKRSLQGYLCASSGILGRSMPGTLTDQARLVDSIESIRMDNFEGLTSLLMQDNQKCVLSLSYRQSLEEDLRTTNTSERLIQEVVTCNMVRQSMEGRTTPSQYQHMLARSPDHIEFLIDVATGVLNTMTFTQRNNLKYFIRYLCYNLPRQLDFHRKVAVGDLKVLFSQGEISSLMERWTQDRSVSPPTIQRVFPESDDHVDVGQLQHELLVTYDPNTIKTLVQKLLPITKRYNICFLSEKWRLPKEFQMTIESLPVSQPAFSSYIHVMVAKARVATQLKMYKEAHTLLLTADQAIKDISYKLSKLLRWEQLKVDLLQHDETGVMPAGANLADIVKRCKACLASLHIDHDLQPSGEMTSLVVVIYLLNQREWDFLCGMSQKPTGYTELGKQMAALCKELPQNKNSRKFARELWEAVTLIFTTSTQQKRSAGGGSTSMNRDGNMGLLPAQTFIKFCGKLRDPQVLSVMISLMTKLYNNLKDDLTVEISSDHLTLWPSTLANSSAINVAMVSEMVSALMDQALKMYPCQASWLRTQADIHYANSQYSLAIKFYLQVGIVLSDFFSKPITRNVYDENVYRRLIRCCTYLHCHTQVAVFCQFLEEVDYTTAFKALQERNIHDAMDTYYSCIWDMTLLEFLVHHHNKKGEFDKKQNVMNLMGQLELNSSNPAEILFEAAKLRKAKFLRAMAQEYI